MLSSRRRVAALLFSIIAIISNIPATCLKWSYSIPSKSGINSRLFSINSANCIQSASIAVHSLANSASFYREMLGFKDISLSSTTAKFKLMDKSEIYLVEDETCSNAAETFSIGDAVVGLGVVRSDCKDVIETINRVAKNNASVITPLGNFSYAASMFPDEEERTQTPVRYGIVRDPDGYQVELKQPTLTGGTCTASKIILNVAEFDDSIAFYTDILGMKLLRRRSNVLSEPRHASMVAYVGYGSETTGVYLELVYNYACETLNHGTGRGRVLTIAVSDTLDVVRQLDKQGKKYTLEEDGTITAIDPSGYQVTIVQGKL